MTSKCSIRNINLPPAPPPTRSYKGKNYMACIDGSTFRIPTEIAKVADMDKVVTVKTKDRSRTVKNAEAYAKWDRMADMAREGWNDRDIALALGYTEKYVKLRIKRMRQSGVDIPERRRGCKKRHV